MPGKDKVCSVYGGHLSWPRIVFISAPSLSKRVERGITAEVRFGVEIGNHELLGEVCEICKQRY